MPAPITDASLHTGGSQDQKALCRCHSGLPPPWGPQRAVFPSPDRSAHPGKVGPDQSTSLRGEL